MPRRRAPDDRLRLRVAAPARWAACALNVLPLPGLGAMWLGWRNPHTRLLRNGALQATLVAFGAWPLVVPGVVGLAWAVHDATRIARARLLPLPPRAAGADAADPAQAAPTKAQGR